MSDRKILNNLLEKYGKDELLNVINEAFSSDKLQGYASRIKKHNNEIENKAKSDRLSKMDRLYKRHYDVANFDGDTRDLGWRDRHDDPEENRKRYEENARHISYDFDSYIRNHKLDSFKSMMHRYGLGDIDWAEVKDADFGEMDKYDAKRLARNPRWNQYILFWERHDGSIYAISRGSVVVYVKRSGYFKDEVKIKDLVDNNNVAKVFVLDISKTGKTRDSKQANRRSARHGMLDRNEETNDMIRRENIARYRRIIAQNHIDKFDKVDNDVRSAIRRSSKAFDFVDADLKMIFKLNKTIERLLVEYESFCKDRDRLNNLTSRDDKSYYGWSAKELNNELKGKTDIINETIETINNLLSQL